MISRLVSVAPMLGWTDRHARYFLRLITKHTLLYTEMVNTGALLHNTQKVGQQRRLLAYHPSEHPLALQLGGSDPEALAACAQLAEDAGFDEVNLNVGCPSDRVRSGHFGACLMAAPELVADCIAAIRAKVSIPVTVKCRIGIDDMEGYSPLEYFVDTVAKGGCDTFIVHARKAWLKGLSPKQNREIPPLKYDYVHRLKSEKPELNIVINGGIKTLKQAQHELSFVDGVMIGREAYYNPWILARVDADIYHDSNIETNSRKQIALQMCDYIDSEISRGSSLHSITRHMLGLYHACPGARGWRRHLSENAHSPDADSSVLKAALTYVES
jgi:tRNA-dihydrouridine synthase A